MRAPSNSRPVPPQRSVSYYRHTKRHDLWTLVKWSLTVIGLLIALAVGVGMGVVIVATALRAAT